MKAGRATQELLISLMRSTPSLSRIDLSRMTILTQYQVSLCEAIGRHPRLQSVCLAETGLKNEYITYKCIEALFAIYVWFALAFQGLGLCGRLNLQLIVSVVVVPVIGDALQFAIQDTFLKKKPSRLQTPSSSESDPSIGAELAELT